MIEFVAELARWYPVPWPFIHSE